VEDVMREKYHMKRDAKREYHKRRGNGKNITQKIVVREKHHTKREKRRDNEREHHSSNSAKWSSESSFAQLRKFQNKYQCGKDTIFETDLDPIVKFFWDNFLKSKKLRQFFSLLKPQTALCTKKEASPQFPGKFVDCETISLKSSFLF